MRSCAWFYQADGTLEWQEVNLPELGEGELLVRLRACGLCTGEIMDWYMRQKAPLVPGHELVGEVEAVGQGVQGFQVGDRVIVHHHAPCGTCELCKRGAHVHCPTWRKTKLTPGGLSERFLVPAEIVKSDLLRVPDRLSDEVAVFTEPLACGVKALRRAGGLHGATVAVIGLGVMGMLNILLAQRWGARRVLAIDRLAHRLEFAQSLGAEPFPPEAEELADSAEVVIVGPGTPSALELGWQIVAPDGALVLFTPAEPEVRYPLDWYTLYFKEVRLIPSYSAGPIEMRQALALLLDGLPVERLITHRLPLTQVPEGYALLRAHSALKVVVSGEW